MYRRAVLMVVFALALGGCASMRKVEIGSDSNSPSNASTFRVDVFNSHSTSLTVSFNDSRGQHELGTVGGNQRSQFVIVSNESSVSLIGVSSSGAKYTKNVSLSGGTTTKVTL